MNRFQAIDPQLLGVGPGDRLLDVGCGAGRHVLELSVVSAHAVGLDWARQDLLSAAYWFHLMRMEGKAKGGVSFLQGEVSRLPFEDGSFDRVVCTEVLEHVPDDWAVLAELVRVLRPGGALAVSVPDELSERLLWRLSRKYRTAPGGHVRIYRRRELVRLLRDGGVRPYAVRFRHSLEACYWLFGSVVSPEREGHPWVAQLRELLSSDEPRRSALLDRCDGLANYLLPKSIVLYARKPREAPA
jgi:ubiquinone/menaquinone biosynthesis C-methylase UbiE